MESIVCNNESRTLWILIYSRGVEITQFMSYIWQRANIANEFCSRYIHQLWKNSQVKREAKQKRSFFFQTERWLSCAMIGLLWLNPLCIMPDVLQRISRDTLVCLVIYADFFLQELINVVRFVRVIQTTTKKYFKSFKATKKCELCDVVTFWGNWTRWGTKQ